MNASLAASLLDLLLGLELGARGDTDPNRFALEGVRWTKGQDGARELRERGVGRARPVGLAVAHRRHGDAAVAVLERRDLTAPHV